MVAQNLSIKSADTLGEHTLDLTAPQAGIELSLSDDGTVMWINVDGVCVLRICRIEVPIAIDEKLFRRNA